MKSPATPFKVCGAAAIIAAGLVAAAIAQDASQPMVWMVAYLVLVTGAVQYALGAGLAQLPQTPPSPGTLWAQWAILNLGHAGVIGGTLAKESSLLLSGTLLYDVAIIWLALAVRGPEYREYRTAYRVLAALMVISSLIGVGLSGLR